jgi:hypothetical protein
MSHTSELETLMKQTKTGRVWAAMFLGLMFGLYRHFEQTKWLGRGRDAFLLDQSHRFDKIVQYHSAGFMLIAGVILAAVVFGFYELISAAITKVLPPSTVEE